jgi:hypothetical protein
LNLVKDYTAHPKFKEIYEKSEIIYQKWSRYKNNFPNDDNSINYIKAKKAEIIENNLKKAKFYYERSIVEKEPKFKSAIKDYISMLKKEDLDEAIRLSNQYISFFDKEEKISFRNIMWQLYETKKDKNEIIKILNSLINQIESKDIWKKKHKTKLITYYKRLGEIYFQKEDYSRALKYFNNLKTFAKELEVINRKIALIYIKKGDLQNARKILEENIRKYADIKSKEMLDELENMPTNIIEENIDEFSIDDLNDLKYFVENYINKSEFRGLSVTKISSKTFKEKDIYEVLNFENVLNSKEKSERMMSAYKIVVSLNKIDKYPINDYLAKSFRYYANYLISNGEFDLAKNFFIASLYYKKNKRILYDYLNLFKNVNSLNMDINQENIDQKIDEVIKSLPFDEREKALGYLNYFLKDKNFYKNETSEFVNNFYNNILILKNLKLETLLYENDNDLDDFDIDILFENDKDFFKKFKLEIEKLKEFVHNNRFEDKIFILERAKNNLEELLKSTENKLTIFSSLFLNNSINQLLQSINEEYNNLKSTKRAKLSIYSPIEKFPKNLKEINFVLNIANKKDLASAENIIVKIGNIEKIIDKIRGGEEESITFIFENNKNSDFTINVEINYFDGIKEEKIIKDFPIIFDNEEFIPIQNPYIPDGDIVKNKKMFYGRDVLIEKLSNKFLNNEMKALVLYGQKRVGKSSLFYHLNNNLEKTNKFFIIEISMGEVESDGEFYRRLIRRIERKYKKIFNTKLKDLIEYNLKEINNRENFLTFLDDFKEILDKNDKQLLLLIDEYTYLFKKIKENSFSKDFLKFIKALLQRNLIKIGVIGQNSMWYFIENFPNEFEVFKKEKLSYLEKKDAKKLIIEPILLPNGENRYKDNSVEYIFSLTNGNPFFIQKICYNVVEFINKKQTNYITLAHLKEVLNLMFKNMTLEGDFDSLISIGDGMEEYNELRKKLIIEIALKSRNRGNVRFEEIGKDIDNYLKQKIIDQLVKSDILEFSNNSYFLKVKLLEEFIRETQRIEYE